jgi:hypothetical protein
VIAGVALLAGRQLFACQSARTLRFLDGLKDEPAPFRMLASPSAALRHGVLGFAHAHEACLDSSFLKRAVDVWPRDAVLWYVFAKFTAIYREEQQTLQCILHTVTTHRLEGATADCICSQALAITHQRTRTTPKYFSSRKS